MSLPPVEIPLGAMRFNSDSQKLEFWNGYIWIRIAAHATELASSGDNGPGARGIYAGGSPGSHYNVIDYFTISTLGNETDFGDLTASRRSLAGVASRTRGVHAGGITPADSWINTIDYITISSTGNATNFGDTTTVTGRWSGNCNQTRGVFGNMNVPAGYVNTLEYIAIATTGNSVEFGDTTTARSGAASGSSSTRGLWAGGWTPTIVNTIDYITIATYGNTVDFGDLTTARGNVARNLSSNSTRAVWCCGTNTSPEVTNTIDYSTIATLGNAIDFGDTSATFNSGATMTSPTRCVIIHKASSNTIEYVEIMSTGNAIEFGDCEPPGADGSGISNAHGGL